MPSYSGRLSPSTITKKVYLSIKEDILTGVYPPGSHLVRRNLAKKYSVSVLPVMEAFYRLETDGLIENSPHLGAFVVNIDNDRLHEELVLREAIECQTARQYALSCSENDKKYLAELARNLDAKQLLSAEGEQESGREFQKLHCDFHKEVARLSGIQLLYRQVKNLWYRRIMFACNLNSALFSNPPGWHAKLADALNSGDPEAAEREMRNHILYNSDKNSLTIEEMKRLGSAAFLESITEGADQETVGV